MGTDLRHCHAVGERTDLGQDHPLARRQGSLQAIGILWLHPDHLDLRAQVLDVRRDARYQATAPTGTKIASRAPGC